MTDDKFKERELAAPGYLNGIYDSILVNYERGQANHGWVFLNTGGNGWDFYSSEFDDIGQRPKLVVEYEAPATIPIALSTQGTIER